MNHTGMPRASGWPVRLLFVALLVQGAPRSAHAERVAVLGVRTADPPVPVGRARNAMLLAGRRHGAELMDNAVATARTRVLAGAVPSAELSPAAHAQELIDEGWRAYVRADIEHARISLERARHTLASILHLPGAPRLFADASLRLGAVLVQSSRVDDARRPLTLAARLDPSREVTLASFTPEVVDAYRESRAQATTRVVLIRVQPNGARVFIDAASSLESVGETTLTVELAPGPHLVVARAPGHRAQARIVDVADADDAQSDVAFALEPQPAARAVLDGAGTDLVDAGRSVEDTALLVEGLLRHGDADDVILVASVWRSGRPALIGQRCAEQPVRCGPVAEIRYPDAAATQSAAEELWLQMRKPAASSHEPRIASDATLWPERSESGRPTTSATGRGCRLCKNPWVWAGVGVALTAAGAVWLLSGDQRPNPIITVDPCRFAACAPPW